MLRLVFRGKLLSKLEAALRSGGLAYPQRPGQELLAKAARQTWVVYAKRPMAGAAQVVRYFSRYTHRSTSPGIRPMGACRTARWPGSAARTPRQ